MVESIVQKTSLVAQVIEDITYEPLDDQRFSAELVGVKKTPHYQQGGYFAFTDLRPGSYQLRIFGERFQRRQFPVTIPFGPVVFNQPGDNELVIVVKTVNGNNRVTFDSTTIGRPINAGADVLAAGLATKLATRLDAGIIAGARFDSVAGLAPGSIVRIIRDRSIRLRFDPYHLAPAELTQIVGTVTLKNNPQLPLENALVRITQVNGIAVALGDVAGATIASATLPGSKTILGTGSDMQTSTNTRGDYNFYFNRDDLTNITLEASLDTFQSVTKGIPVTARARNRADFELEKI